MPPLPITQLLVSPGTRHRNAEAEKGAAPAHRPGLDPRSGTPQVDERGSAPRSVTVERHVDARSTSGPAGAGHIVQHHDYVT